MTRRKPKPKPPGIPAVAWSSRQLTAVPLDADRLYEVEQTVDPLHVLLHPLPPRQEKPAPDPRVKHGLSVGMDSYWRMIVSKKYARESSRACIERIIDEARTIYDQSTYDPTIVRPYSGPEKKKAPWL
jgi:hypothetical protein